MEYELQPISAQESQARKIQVRPLINPKIDSKIMQEEIFGPLLPILTYKNLNEVVETVQKNTSLQHPLALYMFSDHKENIQYILNNIQSGGTCINECILHLANHHLGFGGIQSSGLGQYHGYRGFLEFSHSRSILQSKRFLGLYGILGFEGIRLFLPPYTELQRKLLRFLGKLF
jgi:aldehyde dehydrogenase (NAD+)